MQAGRSTNPRNQWWRWRWWDFRKAKVIIKIKPQAPRYTWGRYMASLVAHHTRWAARLMRMKRSLRECPTPNFSPTRKLPAMRLSERAR